MHKTFQMDSYNHDLNHNLVRRLRIRAMVKRKDDLCTRDVQIKPGILKHHDPSFHHTQQLNEITGDRHIKK